MSAVFAGRSPVAGHRTWFRTLLLASAFVIVVATVLAAFTPTEAAFRQFAPTANCNALHRIDGKGTIQVHHGVAASGGRAERVGVAYNIKRWTNGAWQTYINHRYTATVYPSNVSKIAFPPVHTVRPGHYAVQLALAWNNGSGQRRTWSGWVRNYNVSWGSNDFRATGYCQILG